MGLFTQIWRDPLNSIESNPESGWSVCALDTRAEPSQQLADAIMLNRELPIRTDRDRPDMKRCYELLNLTSRSFAAVIHELDGDLSRVVAIFYLVLRALDTVEDDMSLPIETKAPLLEAFYQKLDQDGWNFQDCEFVTLMLSAHSLERHAH